MGENFFNMSLGRFIFLAFPLAVPGPVQLHGASLLPPGLGGSQLEMGVFGRQPGPDPALSPQACQPGLPCLVGSCLLCLPSVPTRGEAGSAL